MLGGKGEFQVQYYSFRSYVHLNITLQDKPDYYDIPNYSYKGLALKDTIPMHIPFLFQIANKYPNI